MKNLFSLVLVLTLSYSQADVSETFNSLSLLESCTATDGTVGVELWGECYSIENTIVLEPNNNNTAGQSIPAEIGQLTNLEYLGLGSNQLTGEIPVEIGNLTNLTKLILDWNQLTGEIPGEIGSLTNLTHLDLYYNYLGGAIPPEIGDLENLTFLNLSQNELTGEIPGEIGSLTNLTHLGLGGNDLSGAIPPEFGNLSSLEFLDLEYNDLGGAIPPEFGNLSSLKEMGASYNQLTSLPESMGNLIRLEQLVIGNNQLTSLPESIGNIETLNTIWLSLNHLYCEDGQQNEDLIPDFLTDGSITNVFGLYNQNCCEDGLESDCAGVCGGDAVFDECGICEGDGSLCGDFECDAPVCLFIDNVNITAGTTVGTADIYMVNEVEVGGFQFALSGVTLASAFGGTGNEYLGMVTANGNTGMVLGFSMSGGIIPPGEGVLTSLNFSDYADEICFSSVLVTDPTGLISIDTNVGDCFTIIIGCTDTEATNYDPDATVDDGSCESSCDFDLGDVNGDGDISILDLVQISYFILELSTPAYECAADYTQDGTVNILDLVLIVNYILFGE